MTDEERLSRLEKLLALSNLRGPDPTAAPEASHQFFELLNSLQSDTGVRVVDGKQGSLL